MATITPATLMRELETITHAERMRRMVELGRAQSSDPDVRATLRALDRGDFFARYLALQSCQGSRDAARVLRALADPARAIRGLAIQLVASICDDTQARAALDDLPADDRRFLALRLRERGRLAPVDAALDRLAASDDGQLRILLPYGSAAAVERYLPRVVNAFSREDWRRLARSHPVQAAATLLAIARRMPDEQDERFVEHVNGVLPILAELDPEDAVALVGALAPRIPLARLDVAKLAERRPREIVALMLEHNDSPPDELARIVARLTSQQVVALIERAYVYPYGWPALFARLAPRHRAEVYAAIGPGLRDEEGLLDPNVVALLPRQARERVAREHRDLPLLQTRAVRRLAYAGFLPWDEAWAALRPLLDDPDVDLRAGALDALASATRYAPSRRVDLLAVVRAHGNEPDPVRLKMLAALADLPPGHWAPTHLSDLGAIVHAALDATDFSYQTGAATVHLVAALAPFHTAWTARWLAEILSRRGQWFDPERRQPGARGGHLPDRLNDAVAAQLAAGTEPVLALWAAGDESDIAEILHLARSFGRRLRAFPGFADVIEHALVGASTPKQVDELLRLLGRYQPARYAELIPTLLARDPSWITRPAVMAYLQRRRQDLLTPFLREGRLRGRFRTGRASFVLPVFGGLRFRTPRQQRTFAATLVRVASDPGADVPTLASAIGRLADLPAVSSDALVALAHSKREATREVAIRALGRLDGGQGVPALVEALGDDRARVAIYALGPAILAMPSDRAVALLEPLTHERVSVAKEAVRLLGDLGSEASYRALVHLHRSNLHRGVRVALLRALWAFPQHEATWEIFAASAVSPDRALAAVVGRIPAERLSPEAYRRLVDVLATLARHPDPLVRQAALERCAERPVSDPERRLLAAMLDALHSPLPDERAVASAAVVTTYGPRDPALLGETVREYRADRRMLEALAQGFQSAQARLTVSSRRGQIPRRALRRMREHGVGGTWLTMHRIAQGARADLLAPAARAVIDALADDLLTAGYRARLALGTLPFGEAAQILEALAAAGGLYPAALEQAVDGVEMAAHRREDADPLWLEERLRGSLDPRLRRIALAALIASTVAPRGWDEPKLALLRAYRTDPDPSVAAVAEFTLPPQENA